MGYDNNTAAVGVFEENNGKKPLHPGYLGKGIAVNYWVCAYALNQHRLGDEIGSTRLEETPFYRALTMSRGTVSVLDSNGVCWSRIWCVYELYLSLRLGNPNRSYDMYTACRHTWKGEVYEDPEERTAVGITSGLVAVDWGLHEKAVRESHFPIKLMEIGIGFCCSQARASSEQDRAQILEAIQDDGCRLEALVHAAVASSALDRVLSDPTSESRSRAFLKAVRKEPPPQLSVEVSDDERLAELLDALLEKNSCTALKLVASESVEIPGTIGQLSGLVCLELTDSARLRALPGQICDLLALETLILDRCEELRALPEQIGLLSNMKRLTLWGCANLECIPESLGHMQALMMLNLGRCYHVQSLPSTFGQLQSLSTLNCYCCYELAGLPEAISEIRTLELVDLRGCLELKVPEELYQRIGHNTNATVHRPSDQCKR
eukprot:TRINITY_DN13949_c0_g1_i5.p1 TRINITY_DN13949_c0_g1~~TRINITY_DN13949_c0_g1_i5.p1  ORF type:complete len:435 (-),score=75.46 TRINITY_DN13949_c0_g1_i5:331-1635(-)